MKVVRKFAIQGHAVPLQAHAPNGPFPPEVLAGPKMGYEESHSDSLHEGLDDYRLFRCRICGEVLNGEELALHECEEE
jgi:hypothetical protein